MIGPESHTSPAPLRHALRAATVSLLLLVAAGCVGESCEAIASIDTFVPSGQPIHHTECRTFVLDGRDVQFQHVEYGDQQDCPSGCFSSHVCAVVDGADALLFRGLFYMPDEVPADLPSSCTVAAFPDEPADCAPGRSHELIATAGFREWGETSFDDGEFRWCGVQQVLAGGVD